MAKLPLPLFVGLAVLSGASVLYGWIRGNEFDLTATALFVAFTALSLEIRRQRKQARRGD